MVGQYFGNTQYFNPRRVSNLILWLDATDPSANGVQPANGTSISTWVDKSANGNNATQGTGANQPTYTTGARNGLPVLTVSSAAPQYVTGTLAGLAANPNLSVYIICSSTTTAGNPVVFGIGSVNAVPCSIGIGINSGFKAFQWGGFESNFSPANTNYNRLQFTNNNSTNLVSIFVNGSPETSTAGAATALNVNTTFSVGRHSNPIGVGAWDGGIAEVVVYNKVVSAAENTNIYNYLSQKWGF